MPHVTVYFARHAEAHNPTAILYGRRPRVDLSARGWEQAAALADALAEVPLTAIYHSPLLRARRTARAVADRHPVAVVRRSSLLLENLHPLEGKPLAEVAKLGDRVYDADVLGPTGESIADLRDRLARFLHRVAVRHPSGVIVAVGHADPLAALRAHLLGKELSPASLRAEAPPPAGVFRVDFENGSAAQLEWFWRPPGGSKAAPASAAPATETSTQVAVEQHPQPIEHNERTG